MHPVIHVPVYQNLAQVFTVVKNVSVANRGNLTLFSDDVGIL